MASWDEDLTMNNPLINRLAAEGWKFSAHANAIGLEPHCWSAVKKRVGFGSGAANRATLNLRLERRCRLSGQGLILRARGMQPPAVCQRSFCAAKRCSQRTLDPFGPKPAVKVQLGELETV